MTSILALDPATRTGWAHGPGDGTFTSGVWDFACHADAHVGTRLAKFREQLERAFDEHGFDRIAYELASYGAKSRGADTLHHKYQGVIEEFAYVHGRLILMPYYIGTIKKFLTGSGAAKKPQMVAAARRLFNFDPLDDNEADAVAILKLAEQDLLSKVRRTPPTRGQARRPKIKQPKLF